MTDKYDSMNEAELREECKKLYGLINIPHVEDFLQGVVREAAYQRYRWGTSEDTGKTDMDWFWLLGYLIGKIIRPAQTTEKRKHHMISSAAVLMNWHLRETGGDTSMRPGKGLDL